jgi:hypothetical protein
MRQPLENSDHDSNYQNRKPYRVDIVKKLSGDHFRLFLFEIYSNFEIIDEMLLKF